MRLLTEWQFGGWLRGMPPLIAWCIIAVLAAAGLALVAWSYRHTLRALTPAARRPLMVLRMTILLVLLLCLANPGRVDPTNSNPVKVRTLAVLADVSPSMSTPDYRGTTRLADAMRLWKDHEEEIGAAFGKITYQSFSIDVDTASSLPEAAQAADPGAETHLYSALQKTLADGPDAIICLTDGLDTTAATGAELAGEALRRGVPLYFIVGKNRTNLPRGAGMLSIRELNAPAKVLRGADFKAEALFEASATDNGELPVELWSGSNKLGSAQLPLRAGLNKLAWSAPVTATDLGPLPLEFRAGTNPTQVAVCTSEVVERGPMEVLYYQGALQWGYRFLRVALESDPSFQMTSILNPALGVQMTINSVNQRTLPDLPSDPKALKGFQILVLAHVFADQLTAKQQQALVEYARGGGGVLFISPGTEAARRFAGTSLEQMLPIVFEPPESANAGESLPRYQPGRHFPVRFARGRAQSGDELPQLHPFVLPAGGRRSATAALFQNSDPESLPKFSENAKVRAVKPGAEVLAVSGETDDPGTLLARQQFGHGFTATLSTDLLWRWKMSLPSGSHAVEKFWQQLLRSLAPASGQGLRITKLTPFAQVNLPVEILVNAVDADPPVVETISPSGEHRSLRLNEMNDDQGYVWKALFIPRSPGNWEVRALDARQNLARAVFPASVRARGLDLLNLPPDVDGLRRLAESTGGALIEQAAIFPERDTIVPASPPRHIRSLWNSSWLLAALLGLYGTELVLRRCFRLL